MNRLGQKLMSVWASAGSRYFPFADVATPDLPLSRLLRLSLFQVSVGMSLVLLVGTLNRVMIVELGVSSSLVGLMLAMPLVVAPFRALIGFRSDHHRSAIGWRRIPFIYKGTLYQWAGLAIMPLALLVLGGKWHAADAPVWIGQATAALAFLLVGAGVHTVQTAGLALATDLTPPESHPKVVGLMYVMLLLSMMASALIFGMLLADFTPGRLIAVVSWSALLTLALNATAMWKQETRNTQRRPNDTADPSFREAWANFCTGDRTIRRLVAIGLGTMAFGMADVLLEPFGGQVLNMSVSATTKLTALFAVGGLVGFAFASHILGRGGDPYRVARGGAFLGLPAFVLVMIAAPMAMPSLFLLGNFLIGLGAALFGHGTLTATMNRAPKEEVGLALGAWGAVQATAAGVAMAVSGVLRDLVNLVAGLTDNLWGFATAATGYMTVYSIEIVLLLITIVATAPLVKRRRARRMALSVGVDAGSGPTA